MAALHKDAFTSRQFIFIVGEKQATFSLHADIIAKQSRGLNALINGFAREAFEGKAIFEDVGEDTFTRFCQFAYTGDYITPESTRPPTTKLPETSPFGAIPHRPSTSIREGFAEDISKASLRISLYDQLSIKENAVRTVRARMCEARQNSDPGDDYTPVFLGHAKIYVFAEKWGIEPLKTASLLKLHQTLNMFEAYPARLPDIVKLLQYTFSNTPDLVFGIDGLRAVVMTYTACEVERLMGCPDFVSLLEEGGSLARNLVQSLITRIP